MRRCLTQLSNEELDDVLASSEWLRNAVRTSGSVRKKTVIDAEFFRRWLLTPHLSDELVGTLPRAYASDVRERSSEGADIAQPVGVRAWLALEEAAISTAGDFADVLQRIRMAEDLAPAVSPADDLSLLAEPVEPLDSKGLAVLLETLREQSTSLADDLARAVETVRAGRAAESSLLTALLGWNVEHQKSWERLGFENSYSDASFADMQVVLDRLIDNESRREAAHAEQQREQLRVDLANELKETSDVVTTLMPMLARGETFRLAHEEAQAKVAELQRRLQELDDGRPTDTSGPTQSAAAIPAADRSQSWVAEDVAERTAEDVSDRRDDAVDSATPPIAAATSETARDRSLDPEPGIAPPVGAQPDAAKEVHKSSAATFSNADVKESALGNAASRDTAGSPHSSSENDTAPAKRDPDAAAPDLTDDLALHVRAGRFGAAWFVSQAAGLPITDTRVYRLAAAAFHCAPGGIEPSEVLTRLTTLSAETEFDSQQTAQVALAATLRASLTAGWIPRSEVDVMARQAVLTTPTRTLLTAAIDAGDRNYQHLQDFSGGFGPTSEEVRLKSQALRTSLAGYHIKFARADKVLHYLLRSSSPLGQALDAVEAPTSGEQRRARLAAALTTLESPDDVIEAADEQVSSAQQRRTAIIAHARTRLEKLISSVADLVNEALNAVVVFAGDSRTALAQESRHSIVQAAKAIEFDAVKSSAGDAAFMQLVNWVIQPDKPTRTTILELLIAESLPIRSAERDDSGLPVINAANALTIVDELRNPRPAAELYHHFVDRGDLKQAAAAARALPDLLKGLNEHRSRWTRKLEHEIAATSAEVGRTYADEGSPVAQAEADARLVDISKSSDDRFDRQILSLTALRDTLANHRSESAQALRRRVDEEIATPRDRDSIVNLIENDDFVGANELLALARTGPLPDHDSSDAGIGADVFDGFLNALASLETGDALSIRDVIARLTSGEHAGTGEIGHGDLSRLDNWNFLLPARRSQGRGANLQSSMSSVLRAVGLDMRGVTKERGTSRDYTLYRVTATPFDGSLVPGLGSQATHYMVAVTADSKLLRQTLAAAFPTNSGPNIVLFDGVLTAEQRRQCLSVCRSERISAIVVDYAAAAYVAAHYPRSFRALQQLTLPYTCFSHYTVVAGNVPDEVFVGRATEIEELTNRAGSLFVYGGRQLGKSALLRKIQRDFNSVADQHAIFIDLNAYGIGSWSESHKLWQVLHSELVKIDSMNVKPSASVRKPEVVISAIEKWLSGNESRRLLLLLDEADAFLEKESNDTPGFRNIGPLKGLFDNSEGRFKPVFAGLHKVQRLQNVANTPLAHGGRDTLIGPLSAGPARDLVVRPLEALGYRLANDNAVWRLLAFTNLQPGLIQVVCNDLIAHLQSRPLHKGEPLITISDDDLNVVTQNPHTRDKIAEKLRLTIRLEDRYRVIALAVAIMCMEDSFQTRYTADDIREHCEAYWADGFRDLNSTEFTVYLEELIGLGVLIKDDRDRRYSVRSPNIVTMLGTKDQLITELDENEQQFELPPEYNPRSTRRRVVVNGTAIRSPLSEHDLSELVPVRARYEAHNFIVVGSDALGISTVAQVLNSLQDERPVAVTVLNGGADDALSTLSTFKFAAGGSSSPRILVLDASRAAPARTDEIADAVMTLRKRGLGHLVVILSPSGIGAANKFTNAQTVVPTTVIRLEKWSGDGIRSWHDNPFSTPTERAELLAHSSGWPELVERAVREVDSRGISHSEEWQRLSHFPSAANEATAFLQSTGIDNDSSRRLLTQWAQLGSATHEQLNDIAEVLERDLKELQSVVADLVLLGVVDEHHDEFMIDPVVARALTTSA